MKRLILIFIINFTLIHFSTCIAQNLVPNGDFEQYWHCPTSGNQIDSLKFWMQPTLGTSEYFNVCGSGVVSVPVTMVGYQQPRSGAGFIGMDIFSAGVVANNREYVEVQLDSSLIANVCYHFEMYINACNSCKLATYDIGAYFSDTIIQGFPTHSLLSLNSQINNSVGNFPDTLNWTLVSGNFTALGGESYLVIGNFKNDSSTVTSSINPSAFNNFAYTFVDDVSLICCSNMGIINYEKEININVYPNPITDRFTINIDNSEQAEIILYDLSSRKLLQQTFTNTTTLNTEQLAKGMYLYTVRNKNGIIKNGKVIKQ